MEKTQGDTRTPEKQGGMSNQKTHQEHSTMRPGMNDPNEKNPKPNTGDSKIGQGSGNMGQDDKKTADRPTMHDSADDKRNNDGSYQKSDDKRVTNRKPDDKMENDDIMDDDDDNRNGRSNPNKDEQRTERADSKRSGGM